MRGVTAVLVLILAACSTAGGDTTTTAPLAEPSTTSTTAEPTTTTTTEPTTTTTVEECTERDGDGVLRNRRGFVCPPTMHTYTGGITIQDLPQQYLPGTYTSRAIEPPIRFHRIDRFRSIGETPAFAVNLDTGIPASPSFTDLFDAAPSAALTAVSWEDLEWISDLSVTDESIADIDTIVLDFAVPEDAPCGVNCSLDIGVGQPWEWPRPIRVRLFILDIAGGPSVFHVQALPEDFDTYWSEVAQPILDSIEFLDP